MGTAYGRDYLTNPREFDGWLAANAVLGSVLAVAILGAALASFLSPGTAPDGPIELSSVNRAAD